MAGINPFALPQSYGQAFQNIPPFASFAGYYTQQPLQQIFQLLQIVPQQLQQLQQLQYVQQQQLQQLQQLLHLIPAQLAQLQQLIQVVPQQIQQMQPAFGQGVATHLFGAQPGQVM